MSKKTYVKCLASDLEFYGFGKDCTYVFVGDMFNKTIIENDEGQRVAFTKDLDGMFELVEKPTKKRSVKPLTEYEQKYILDRPNDSSRSLAKQLWGVSSKRKSSINDFRKRVKESDDTLKEVLESAGVQQVPDEELGKINIDWRALDSQKELGDTLEMTLVDVKVDATGANTETVSDAVRELVEYQQKSGAGMTKATNGGVKEVFDKAKKRAEEHDNSRILLISDMHIPYHHPDTVEFLQHLKEKYNPTRVVSLGDELDKHALSFHDSDPDLPSAGDELRMSLPVIAQLHKVFPKMDILDSNHGSLVYRKSKHHGIPRHYLRSYREVLEVGEGWTWHHELTLDLPHDRKVYLCHGKMADVTKLSQQTGMCAIQGHYHNGFKVEYWGNSFQLYWAMQVGCLIDDKSLAFSYNKLTVKRPVIGTGLIIDGQPILEPLLMGDDGRWVGRKK